jgi:RNA polymerase sigma-70 factor (ECF subfamily)
MKVHESALEILYQKYSSKMMVVCSRYTSDEESAQELLQDGFIRVLENLYKLKCNINYEDYIRRIIVDIVIETYKKRVKSTQIVTE